MPVVDPPWTGLTETLHRHATDRPGALALAVTDGEDPADRLTYRELWRRAAALAAVLRRRRTGDGPWFVLIALPSGADYVIAFYACLLARCTAVTFYPPQLFTTRAVRAFDTRLRDIEADCHPFAVIGTPEVLDRFRGRPDAPLLLDGAATDGDDPVPSPGAASPGAASPGDLALLQYTSGSTSRPKGVMVTHGNLAHNVRAIARHFSSRPGEGLTSWLPLYHDLGLIGAVLHPLDTGMSVHLMPPSAFLRRPVRWLRLIAESRSALTMAPDFAYALVARRVQAGALDGDDPDLSCLRHAVNAAEPIRPRTVAAFRDALRPYGLGPDVMTPGYGLAENTLCVTALDHRRDSTLVTVPGQDRVVVSCGRVVLPGADVVIVDPDLLRPVPPGSVGEIWVSGPSVAAGYWRRPAETAATFGARLPGDPRRFLRTGDLGVWSGEALCVVGRRKDTVVRNGTNIHLHDLEATATGCDPAVEAGTAAAFVLAGDPERLVLVQELAGPLGDLDPHGLLRAIRSAVAEEHGVTLDAVALLRRGAVPKTTSGKIQRSACADRWRAGEFAPIAIWRTHALERSPRHAVARS